MCIEPLILSSALEDAKFQTTEAYIKQFGDEKVDDEEDEYDDDYLPEEENEIDDDEEEQNDFEN